MLSRCYRRWHRIPRFATVRCTSTFPTQLKGNVHPPPSELDGKYSTTASTINENSVPSLFFRPDHEVSEATRKPADYSHHGQIPTLQSTPVKSSIDSTSYLIPYITQDGGASIWQSPEASSAFEPAKVHPLGSILNDIKTNLINAAQQTLFFQIEKKVALGMLNEALMDWLSAPSGPTMMSNSGNAQKLSSTPQPLIIPSNPSFEMLLTAKHFDKAWLKFGARLYAMAKQSEQVAAIVKQLKARFADENPALTVYVIQHLNKNDPEANAREAWSTFTNMLHVNEYKPPFEDYATVFFSFLSEPGVQYASTVLCLMSKTFKNDDQKSQAIHSTLLKKLLPLCKTMTDVDQLSHKLIDNVSFPKAKGSIFNSWLRESARSGDHKHTASVIQLMLKKGTKPTAKHIDHLLQSLMRYAGPEQAKQAEALALIMIQKQLSIAGGESVVMDNTSLQLTAFPKQLRKNPPPADPRTYTQLMEYYVANGQPEAARIVLKLLLRASHLRISDEIKLAIISIYSKMKAYPESWTFFQSQSFEKDYDIRSRAYHLLWKALEAHQSTTKLEGLHHFPTPRLLFNHMINDLMACQQPVELPLTSLKPTTYERIIRCFCIAEDTPGVLTAIHSIKHLFDMSPSLETVVQLVKHFTHKDMWDVARGAKLEFIKEYFDQYSQRNTELMDIIWGKLQDMNSSSTLSRSVSTSSSFPKSRQAIEYKMTSDEVLLLITTFFKAYLHRKRKLGNRFPRATEDAKFDMGMSDVPLIDRRLKELINILSMK